MVFIFTKWCARQHFVTVDNMVALFLLPRFQWTFQCLQISNYILMLPKIKSVKHHLFHLRKYLENFQKNPENIQLLKNKTNFLKWTNNQSIKLFFVCLFSHFTVEILWIANNLQFLPLELSYGYYCEMSAHIYPISAKHLHPVFVDNADETWRL